MDERGRSEQESGGGKRNGGDEEEVRRNRGGDEQREGRKGREKGAEGDIKLLAVFGRCVRSPDPTPHTTISKLGESLSNVGEVALPSLTAASQSCSEKTHSIQTNDANASSTKQKGFALAIDAADTVLLKGSVWCLIMDICLCITYISLHTTTQIERVLFHGR